MERLPKRLYQMENERDVPSVKLYNTDTQRYVEIVGQTQDTTLSLLKKVEPYSKRQNASFLVLVGHSDLTGGSDFMQKVLQIATPIY